jgi:hypothetical protein
MKERIGHAYQHIMCEYNPYPRNVMGGKYWPGSIDSHPKYSLSFFFQQKGGQGHNYIFIRAGLYYHIEG